MYITDEDDANDDIAAENIAADDVAADEDFDIVAPSPQARCSCK